MEGYLDDEILEITAQGMDFFDEAWVLHGAEVVLGNEDGVILAPRVRELVGLVTFTETYLFRSRAARALRTGSTGPIVPAIREAEAGEWREPRRWNLQ